MYSLDSQIHTTMNGTRSEEIDHQKGRMFVGGVSWDTAPESFQKYFSNYGELLECKLMNNSETGRPRGFGFITFADPSSVNDVLQSGPHQLDGQTIHPKISIPRYKKDDKKIFMGGLPINVNETDVLPYFSRYGKVTEVRIVYDRLTKRSRGFGFVIFDNTKSADLCCKQPFVYIDGKLVEIKKADNGQHYGSNFKTALMKQNIMSILGLGMGTMTGLPLFSIGGVMPGYQAWGTLPTAGYAYTGPTQITPAGCQGWEAHAGLQPLPCCFDYGAATQPVEYSSNENHVTLSTDNLSQNGSVRNLDYLESLYSSSGVSGPMRHTNSTKSSYHPYKKTQ